MQKIQQSVQATLQTLYRQAIDADHLLDQLQQAQQGKFQAIFKPQQGFTTHAKRFGPYVQEVVEQWQRLQELDEEALKQALPEFVGKLQLMLSTLAQFNQSAKLWTYWYRGKLARRAAILATSAR